MVYVQMSKIDFTFANCHGITLTTIIAEVANFAISSTSTTGSAHVLSHNS